MRGQKTCNIPLGITVTSVAIMEEPWTRDSARRDSHVFAIGLPIPVSVGKALLDRTCVSRGNVAYMSVLAGWVTVYIIVIPPGKDP